MNERIRKIAEEARLYADEQYPGSFVKYDPKWFEFYNEKFVELIVRKCADICNKIYFDHYPDAEHFERSEEGDAIKQYFGIEE